MDALPPARRARRALLRFGALASAFAFVVVGGTVLIDQWIFGHAGAAFIIGTAVLIAGGCLGLFAIIAAIGLAFPPR
jgi:hypothetical protein